MTQPTNAMPGQAYPASAGSARDRRKLMALIYYDPGASIENDESEVQVAFTRMAVGFMATLADEELKVLAALASIVVRRAFEMPPSPNNQI
jgi:hypothetical protein